MNLDGRPATVCAAGLLAGGVIAGWGGLPAAVPLLLMALAAALVAWLYWNGQIRQGYLLAAAPLILLTTPTGGATSPFAAALAVWLAGTARWLSTRGRIVAGVAVWLVLIVSAPTQNLSAAILHAGIIALAGTAGAFLLPVGEARRSRRATPHAGEGWAAAPQPAFDAEDSGRRIHEALESVRAQTGAERAVLWSIDADGDHATPTHVAGGETPAPRALAGDPMRWVIEELMPLRLERAPRGLGGSGNAACVVPAGDHRILSLEYEPATLPSDAAAVADAGRYLDALIVLENARREAYQVQTRSARLLDLLRQLAAANGGDELAAVVAETAVTLTGGTGAAVARWAGDDGVVLAVTGEDGGPLLQTRFGGRDSEMALAARGGALLVRERSGLIGGGDLPVASRDDRWYSQPRALALLPFAVSTESTRAEGVLAVWDSQHATLDDAGLVALQAVAPYVALEFGQADRHDELRQLADTDPLTGLPNRGSFSKELHRAIVHYERYGDPLSVVLFDIDHFKDVNDTYGHDAGDEVLRVVAGVLASDVRGADRAARFGGEEFVVLLPHTDLAPATDTAERIRRALQELRIEHEGRVIPLTASFGVSSAPACVRDPHELVSSADRALYTAKAAGRNRVMAAGPLR